MKSRNAFSSTVNEPWPNNRILANLPIGVEVPKELAIVIGYLTQFVNFHKGKRTVIGKVANTVKSISYDTLAHKPRTPGWIAIHFSTTSLSISQKMIFRNRIDKLVRFSNKPYKWSAIIGKSDVPGCSSRIAIGPRTVNQGTGLGTYSKGTKYAQTIVVNF